MEHLWVNSDSEQCLARWQSLADDKSQPITLEDLFKAALDVHQVTKWQFSNNGHRPIQDYPALSTIGYEEEPGRQRAILLDTRQGNGSDILLIRELDNEGCYETVQLNINIGVESRVRLSQEQKRELLLAIIASKPLLTNS
ncbi:hypothetical protein A2870_00090 [Candidatus Curtissbacteria bacterium RIFCSPHIGHO2_01_FULL_41_11]|uniref:Uncharacterized protein n=1 Tax=Candidatus Curtissbacteria bacterium RIFCSPHIGHO2_01_FULL_41_11 TaxID=1797711 RepID=A0A1F5G347_9BACT|nr:MAG: hypothetical protein A2870_00090 [Candidatus Curtissbacteria bacterium RIFCSPHIGHO2_01_FULL_41_11]